MTTQKSTFKIFVAFLLNLGFSIFELIGGFLTNSIAISSDAIHDFGDALSIGIAFFLEKRSQHRPDSKYTYGYLRYSVIGSLITTLILIGGSVLVIAGAISRIVSPVTVNYDGMIILAIIGVIVNFTAVYFTRDGESLNQRAVSLHMLEDVLGWAVVLIGVILMHFTDINLIDPILSIGVALFILLSAFKNFREIFDLFLEKSPRGITPEDIEAALNKIPHIKSVHHIHLWSMDGNTNYATMHVVTNQPTQGLKSQIRAKLKQHHISHVTIEFESTDEKCSEEICCPSPTEHHHTHHHH